MVNCCQYVKKEQEEMLDFEGFFFLIPGSFLEFLLFRRIISLNIFYVIFVS